MVFAWFLYGTRLALVLLVDVEIRWREYLGDDFKHPLVNYFRVLNYRLIETR